MGILDNIFGTQQQQQVAVDAPNTLRSKAVAEILFAICEGPIQTPSNLETSIFLDGVPLKSSDGSYNFKNVFASLSQGTSGQTYIPGTTAAETTVSVSTEVEKATPIVRAISDVTATSARVSINIPALQRTDTTTGSTYPTAVAFHIDVQPNGGAYQTVVTDTVRGKCISPVQFDYDFDLPGTGPWNVKVIRDTNDSAVASLVNKTFWATLSILRDYRLAYPDTAMLRLRIDAEQFAGSFPTIAYQGSFLSLEIPSNYNPVARTYSGIWDGTFTTAWTNNPAWVLWACLTNDRWGLGRWINTSAVDKWLLYDAGVWFDELVSDGYGELEPRFVFNGVIDSAESAYNAIVMIAGACQAMPYWASGAVNFVVDKPMDPVKQVGPANVVGGKFIYQGSDLATRPTAVYVTWFDPENSYQRAVEIVDNPEMVSRHGLRIKEIAGVFCTSQNQASRIGRYELETAWSETQTATWSVGEDQHDLVPGDLVDISDPSIQGRRTFGRLVAISGTTITLDNNVTIDSGQTYELRVMDQSGALQTRSVLASPGETSSLTILSAFSPEPIVGAVWQLIASNLAPRRFRVITVDENTDENTYTITAVFHDQNKQARVEGGVILDLPAISAYGTGPIAAPIDLMATEIIEQLPSGTYRLRVTLGWAKHTDPRVVRYEVEWKESDDSFWTNAGYAPGTTAELDELGGGSHQFRVRAIGFDGKFSPWSAELTKALTGLDDPPPDVTDLKIMVIDAIASLEWATISIPNLDHYEVRFAEDTGANWQSMVPIALSVSGTNIQTAARTGIYAVKAVTAQGIYSDNAATVSSNITGLAINIIETSNAHPTWSGTKSQCEFEDARDALKLSIESGYDVYETGTYTWPTYIDLGEIFTSRVNGAIVAFGEETTNDIWDEPDIWSLSTVWGSDPSGWDVYFEVQTTDNDPAGSTPVWSDWRRFVVSDMRFRAIWPRLVLKRGISTVTPIVTEASLIIDMPDRPDAQGGVSVSSSGTRVSFTSAFKGPTRPAVVITGIENAAADDWADVTNVDTTGFDITIRNAAGVAQSGRSIDYHAQGYGKVITP